jgi:O-antigen/teichoic acid export membrane protein
MLKNIFTTLLSRIFIAASGLIILVINARELGSEGIGEIALFNLWCALFTLLGNSLGGGNLVFYAARYPVGKLLAGSYLWSGSLAFLLLIAGSLFPVLPYYPFIALGMVLNNASLSHQNVMLGKQDIKLQNISSVTYNFTLLFTLVFQYFVLLRISVLSFVYAYAMASFVQWVVSWFLSKQYFDFKNFRPDFQLGKLIFKEGLYTQGGTLVQQLNYRLSYFFVEHYWGKATLGLLSAAIQLGEGVWLLSRSAAVVLYSKVSQGKQDKRMRKTTFVLGRWLFIITALLVLLLASLPDAWFASVLGPDFLHINMTLLALTPALAIYAAHLVYAHYVSGIGGFWINFKISLWAFLGMFLSTYLLVPTYAAVGAIVATSISYFISASLTIRYILSKKSLANVYFWSFKTDFKLFHDFLAKKH